MRFVVANELERIERRLKLHEVRVLMATVEAGSMLTIPLISNEPVNIGEKRLFTQELAEFFHERPQSRLLHGWNELVMHAALTEQRMCSSLGGAGFEMFVETESFASGAE